MPTYKLVYFDARGRAEVSRLMFAYAKQEYEDKRITQEFFKETVKPKTPMGQLPVLAVDGKHLAQTGAIQRFLAKQFKLMGSDDFEAAQIDMYCCGVEEFFASLAPVFQKRFAGQEEEAAKLLLELKESKVTPFLCKYTEFLEKSSGDFMVGSKPSLIDFVMQMAISSLAKMPHDLVKGHDKLIALEKRVAELPGVKEWIDKRPETNF